ncbi:hypothetical protein GGR53DRAFT_529176 [Hypoxylon sp. FL1150]|nr:hypothetical protein GGR53DRAFT_529176 [Hypoxylon sp. FL1150]
MFLMRMTGLTVVAVTLFDMTAATPLASAGAAQALISSPGYMQQAAVLTVKYPEKRDDDTAYGCHNPGPEFGPAPSVEDCTAAIKLTEAKQGDITLNFNDGCTHTVSGNCTASTCPLLGQGPTFFIAPVTAAQYMNNAIMPNCIAKGFRGWYSDRTLHAGMFLS